MGAPKPREELELAEVPALRRSEWPHDGAKHRASITRSEAAARKIAQTLAEVRPGGRIGTKEQLRLRYGISVGTLNEALRLLQARGLVTVRPGPGGGLFASAPSPMARLGNLMLTLDSEDMSVADAVRVRNALHHLLIGDAIGDLTSADIAALRAILVDLAAAAEYGDDIAFVQASYALHTRIATMSSNRMLTSIYVGLLEVIEARTRLLVPPGVQSLQEFLADRYMLHAHLVDALAARDLAAALRLIAQHDCLD